MGVVYRTATSLDGFIADEDNGLEWLFEVPDGPDDGASFGEFLDEVGVLVMGRTTYEWVLDHEKLLDDPLRWKEFYGERPTWVFSHHDLPPLEGVDIRFVSGPVSDHHEAVVASGDGRDVWVVGGGDLVGQYADVGLLDRVLLDVTPVFLGAGAPLLPRRLTSSRVTLRGVKQAGQLALLHYDVTGPVSSPPS